MKFQQLLRALTRFVQTGKVCGDEKADKYLLPLFYWTLKAYSVQLTASFLLSGDFGSK